MERNRKHLGVGVQEINDEPVVTTGSGTMQDSNSIYSVAGVKEVRR